MVCTLNVRTVNHDGCDARLSIARLTVIYSSKLKEISFMVSYSSGFHGWLLGCSNLVVLAVHMRQKESAIKPTLNA